MNNITKYYIVETAIEIVKLGAIAMFVKLSFDKGYEKGYLNGKLEGGLEVAGQKIDNIVKNIDDYLERS